MATPPVEVYIDPSIAADSGTGTSGDPYGDLQYAIDNTTLAASGTRFNVKAGTAEILTKAVDFTSGFTGTTGTTKHVIIEGYTTTAGDGGIGELEGTTNSVAIWTGALSLQHTFIKHMKMTGGTTGFAVTLDQRAVIYACEIVAPDDGITFATGRCMVLGCKITFATVTAGGNGIVSSNTTPNMLIGNYLVSGGKGKNGIDIRAAWTAFNIIDMSNTDQDSCIGLTGGNLGSHMTNNTIKGGAGTINNKGIYVEFGSTLCSNNYVEGFNGTGDVAYSMVANGPTLMLHNKWFDCTSGYTTPGEEYVVVDENNAATAASGVTNLAGDDFTPTSELQGAGWPTSFKGLAGNASAIDVGAVQATF